MKSVNSKLIKTFLLTFFSVFSENTQTKTKVNCIKMAIGGQFFFFQFWYINIIFYFLHIDLNQVWVSGLAHKKETLCHLGFPLGKFCMWSEKRVLILLFWFFCFAISIAPQSEIDMSRQKDKDSLFTLREKNCLKSAFNNIIINYRYYAIIKMIVTSFSTHNFHLIGWYHLNMWLSPGFFIFFIKKLNYFSKQSIFYK